ncbi:hypothetical protein J8273_5941 [Carpediemonas membranifera]|uniref:Uncharacterized protein n=1 Tax=Carpediemonas membranifera TaxID=201153 RepID=A0A8J6AS49_9EUKA|nr:hypothetical protein J8273_5941 [Carpediemonas membranifera]|eukprot:KAG9392683.1 hypothetical protein J8273_5941 [Carpediemonas membranifera]
MSSDEFSQSYSDDFVSDYSSDFESESESSASSVYTPGFPVEAGMQTRRRAKVTRCDQTAANITMDVSCQVPIVEIAPPTTALDAFLLNVTRPVEEALEENLHMAEVELQLRAEIMPPQCAADAIAVSLNRNPPAFLSLRRVDGLAPLADAVTVQQVEFRTDAQYELFALYDAPPGTPLPPLLRPAMASAAVDASSARLTFIVKWNAADAAAESATDVARVSVLVAPSPLTTIMYHPAARCLVAGTEWGGIVVYPMADLTAATMLTISPAVTLAVPHCGPVAGLCAATTDTGAHLTISVCSTKVVFWGMGDQPVVAHERETGEHGIRAVALAGQAYAVNTDKGRVRTVGLDGAAGMEFWPVPRKNVPVAVSSIRATPAGQGVVAAMQCGFSLFRGDEWQPGYTYDAYQDHVMTEDDAANDAILSPWHPGIAFFLDDGECRMVDINTPDTPAMTLFPRGPGPRVGCMALSAVNVRPDRPDSAVPRLALGAGGAVVVQKLALPMGDAVVW